jgi:hypothetical protein
LVLAKPPPSRVLRTLEIVISMLRSAVLKDNTLKENLQARQQCGACAYP